MIRQVAHEQERPQGPPDLDHGAAQAPIRVWDRGVILFHWSLVCAVAVALVTGFLAPRWWLDAHVIAGVIMTTLVIFRLVWGFCGSTYARFGSFVPTPATVLRHARDLLAGTAHHHIGHNPLGAAMIAALLVVLSALAVTGIVALGGALKEGPLAPVASYGIGASSAAIHELAAWLLLALVAGHLLGVVIESVRTRENLARAMVTGRKRIPPGAITAPARPAMPLRASLILAVLAAAIVPAAAFLSLAPGRGVPVEKLDVVYAKECSACHSVHHPSLASAAVWTRIVDGLSDHFGDNASLDPDQASRLRTYLAANSAEAYDTRAANVLRVADPAGSLRITRTAGWQSIHKGLPPATFDAPTVKGRLNCQACHADAASGHFAPRSISLPSKGKQP